MIKTALHIIAYYQLHGLFLTSDVILLVNQYSVSVLGTCMYVFNLESNAKTTDRDQDQN